MHLNFNIKFKFLIFSGMHYWCYFIKTQNALSKYLKGTTNRSSSNSLPLICVYSVYKLSLKKDNVRQFFNILIFRRPKHTINHINPEPSKSGNSGKAKTSWAPWHIVDGVDHYIRKSRGLINHQGNLGGPFSKKETYTLRCTIFLSGRKLYISNHPAIRPFLLIPVYTHPHTRQKKRHDEWPIRLIRHYLQRAH